MINLQIDRQLQEMCVEYKDLCDIFLSVLATAENMVKDDNKKYGHYDEFDSSKYKTDDGLALQFLRLLKTFKENRSDFNSEYRNNPEAYRLKFISDNGTFKFPEKINLKIVEEKVALWKSLTKNETYHKYFNEIIHILNYDSKLDLDIAKKSHYTKVRNDEQKKENIKNIMKVKAAKKKEDEPIIDEVAETGGYVYEPVYNDKPGRWRI
jgi:hypothetical protein